MKPFCCICGHEDEQLLIHLKRDHDLSMEQYLAEFDNAPVLSGELRDCLSSVIPKSEQLRDEPVHLIPRLDQTYRFPEESELVINGLKHGDKILLVGPTGCGKSQLALQLAARERKPVIRFNLHGETSVSNFLGHWVVQGKEMKFLEGVLPTAMRNGYWLLLDELDACTPQVSFLLHSVLEEKGSLVMADKDGEVVEPHPDFRIIATANTIGKGEDSALYNGTQILNEAFLDRFGTVISLDYLPFDEEVKVLLAKVQNLAPVVAAGLTTVASEIRKAFTEETVYCTFSTRRLVNWAKKYMSLGDINNAAEIAILNRLSQDDRKVVEEVIQRYFG